MKTIFTFTQWMKNGEKIIVKGVDIYDALSKVGISYNDANLDYYKIGVE